ncbi:hypothetical protein B484DRAFT_260633, partial [Ochromonadaceae sp. CCMP2298]
MYVCMYVCIYICMYLCIYVCMYVCIYVCISPLTRPPPIYVCMCVYMYVYVCMYVCMCVCICICVCVYVCMYICMCVCMNVCVYVYISPGHCPSLLHAVRVRQLPLGLLGLRSLAVHSPTVLTVQRQRRRRRHGRLRGRHVLVALGGRGPRQVLHHPRPERLLLLRDMRGLGLLLLPAQSRGPAERAQQGQEGEHSHEHVQYIRANTVPRILCQGSRI